ncbi:MAG: hypothetical protein OEY22_01580 [Candidatus Bathyarchaeota archaeon]|nr:hypothetical protein [Candidatus Bathyarchaeota archaeon]MDH5788544.1 hypothetical protein [Candidatus Bathyarchaeota archaeon]
MACVNMAPDDFTYKYKTVSVSHLDELQQTVDKLRHEGKLSNHPTYRLYIDTKKFQIPEDFPTAKSLIILATPSKAMRVNFNLDGKNHEVLISPEYYYYGLTNEILQNIVQEKIIGQSGYRIERTKQVHLKLLAVRSGLGKYGRNNLCYVEGMGSFVTLYAFFTDYPFGDNWTEMGMMDICENCGICMHECPTKSINEENFVIDAGRCLSLYNEIKGDFPEWIKPDAHNALMGCMKCQWSCPANTEAVKSTGRFEEVTEEETKKILEGTPDKKLLDSLSRKLKEFEPTTSNEEFPVLTRNLRALLRLNVDQRD